MTPAAWLRDGGYRGVYLVPVLVLLEVDKGMPDPGAVLTRYNMPEPGVSGMDSIEADVRLQEPIRAVLAAGAKSKNFGKLY
jgi:hypothetical protein